MNLVKCSLNLMPLTQADEAGLVGVSQGHRRGAGEAWLLADVALLHHQIVDKVSNNPFFLRWLSEKKICNACTGAL